MNSNLSIITILLLIIINCSICSIKNDIIDDLIEKEISEGFPGATLLVTQHGKIQKQHVYGYRLRYDENGRSIKEPQSIEMNTVFDMASLTKMYATNFAIMHLVSQGKLDVNDPIVKYIPEYTGCNPVNKCRQTRLIRDSLTHTAGYLPSVEFYDPKRVPEDMYSQTKSKTEEIILTKLGFDRPRGGKPIYSDIDFMLLGIVVERITGFEINEYVKTNIYQPLNLTHTLFNPLINTTYQISNFAATELKGNTRNGTINFPNIRRYVLEGQVHDEKSFYSMNGLSGHAGLFSNLNDMNILTQVMLNNGTFNNIHLWNSTVEQLFLTPYNVDPTYGLGWRLNTNKSLYFFGQNASELAYGHTGWTGTCTVIDPKYSLAIILLTNKRHSQFINGSFVSDQFQTGNYGKIMTLVYQLLNI